MPGAEQETVAWLWSRTRAERPPHILALSHMTGLPQARHRTALVHSVPMKQAVRAQGKARPGPTGVSLKGQLHGLL